MGKRSKEMPSLRRKKATVATSPDQEPEMPLKRMDCGVTELTAMEPTLPSMFDMAKEDYQSRHKDELCPVCKTAKTVAAHETWWVKKVKTELKKWENHTVHTRKIKIRALRVETR